MDIDDWRFSSILYACYEHTVTQIQCLNILIELTCKRLMCSYNHDYWHSGPNPLFGGLKSTTSVFGKSSHTWIEGEGMLHALYFSKDKQGRLKISYNNRHVETDTFKLERDRKKPGFLPAIEGDSLAVLLAYLLNWVRK